MRDAGPARPDRPGRWTWALGALLAAAVLALYARTAGFDYVNLDDRFYVYDNPRVLRGLGASGVAWAFTTFEQANWHPLTWISHMLDASLFGPGPAGPHAVNAALHLANTLLLFGWLRSATGATARSFAVAALFAVHPLHVESVAWVSERKDVLCTFLWFLSIAAWLRWTRTRGAGAYAASLALFALSLVAKPMSVTQPFVLLLLDAWPLRRAGPGGRPWRALVVEKLPFFALTAASCVVTFVAQRTAAMSGLDRLPLGARIENAVVAYAAYLARTVWPEGLSVMVPHPGMLGGGHAAATVAASAAVLAVLAIVAVRLRGTQPWLAWGGCWYLGTLVPVIGLVQVGFQALADRYTYVPLVGVFVAIVWGAATLAERWRVPRIVKIGGFGLVAHALAVTAAFQVGHWRDSVALNLHAVQADDTNAVAWAGLGDAYLARGRSREAIEAYRKALSIGPMLAGVEGHLESGLGVEAGRAGRHAEAVAHFERAVEADPDDAVTWFNLGSARGNLGRHAEAAEAFERALALRPDDARALAGIAIASLQLGDRARALSAIERLRPIDPARAESLAEHARRPPR